MFVIFRVLEDFRSWYLETLCCSLFSLYVNTALLLMYSWVAERPVASQEGFGSVELVSYTVCAHEVYTILLQHYSWTKRHRNEKAMHFSGYVIEFFWPTFYRCLFNDGTVSRPADISQLICNPHIKQVEGKCNHRSSYPLSNSGKVVASDGTYTASVMSPKRTKSTR
jgi:hypothetical protein